MTNADVVGARTALLLTFFYRYETIGRRRYIFILIQT